MWFFGKDKNKKDKGEALKAPAVPPAMPMTSKQAKTQALMEQMRSVRAEIGEENLKKLADKLRLDELKNKVRHDIENDPKKRDRLMDELRLHMQDKDKPY